MENKKLWMGIPVMVLVFGMTVLGCTDRVDRSLNGTWVNSSGDAFEFNNGRFECRNSRGWTTKGTYTTKDSSLKFSQIPIDGTGQGLNSSMSPSGPNSAVSYSINGDTLMIGGYMSKFNDAHIFTKKQESNPSSPSNTSGKSASKVKEKDLVGRWVTEDGSTSLNISTLELSNDGNGEMNGNTKVSWKVENDRLVLTTLGIGNVYSYGYKIAGKKLTLTDDRWSTTFVKNE